ncbi:MAG: Mur ligase domain-containing protein, partial [Kaistella sp.]
MNAASFYPLFLKANKVTIDSRTVEENDIFFAFSGDNFNAAISAEDAVNKGALAVLVEDQTFEDAERNIFYVPSTLAFLQELASYHRSHMKIPVIALTGSNGKTTT